MKKINGWKVALSVVILVVVIYNGLTSPKNNLTMASEKMNAPNMSTGK